MSQPIGRNDRLVVMWRTNQEGLVHLGVAIHALLENSYESSINTEDTKVMQTVQGYTPLHLVLSSTSSKLRGIPEVVEMLASADACRIVVLGLDGEI